MIELLSEALRTSVHPLAVITRPIRGWQMPCRWHGCGRETAIAVSGVQLCEDHAARRLGRLPYDAKIAGLIDLIRFGGFEALEPDAALHEEVS